MVPRFPAWAACAACRKPAEKWAFSPATSPPIGGLWVRPRRAHAHPGPRTAPRPATAGAMPGVGAGRGMIPDPRALVASLAAAGRTRPAGQSHSSDAAADGLDGRSHQRARRAARCRARGRRVAAYGFSMHWRLRFDAAWRRWRSSGLRQTFHSLSRQRCLHYQLMPTMPETRLRPQPLLVNIYRLVSNKGNLEALDPKPLGNLRTLKWRTRSSEVRRTLQLSDRSVANHSGCRPKPTPTGQRG